MEPGPAFGIATPGMTVSKEQSLRDLADRVAAAAGDPGMTVSKEQSLRAGGKLPRLEAAKTRNDCVERAVIAGGPYRLLAAMQRIPE